MNYIKFASEPLPRDARFESGKGDMPNCLKFCGFLQSRQANATTVPHIRLWPPPSTSFTISHSLTVWRYV